MLRLFSNIRKTLINEGKTSRYVRYAVGETVLVVLSVMVSCSLFGQTAPIESSEPLTNGKWILSNVTVIDVEAGHEIHGKDIIIEGEEIAEVIPHDASTISSPGSVDGTGKFVIPGLFDMHAHIFGTAPREPDLQRYVEQGVVGIRDLGAPIEALLPVIAEASFQTKIAPHIWFAGPIIDAPRVPFHLLQIVRDTDEASQAVTSIADAGAHFIKVHDLMPPRIYQTIAKESRNRGLPLVGHVPGSVSLDEAIAAGQRSIEHLGGLTHNLLRACSFVDSSLHEEVMQLALEDDAAAYRIFMSSRYLTPLIDGFDPDLCAKVATMLAEGEIWQVPNLVLWRFWAETPPENFELNSEDLKATQRLFETTQQIVRIFNDHGVPILAGVDEIRGATIHDELKLLVNAGLTPMEALQAATIDAARFLKVDDSMGKVAPGYRADFLILDGNPLESIENSSRIRTIIFNGRPVILGTVVRD